MLKFNEKLLVVYNIFTTLQDVNKWIMYLLTQILNHKNRVKPIDVTTRANLVKCIIRHQFSVLAIKDEQPEVAEHVYQDKAANVTINIFHMSVDYTHLHRASVSMKWSCCITFIFRMKKKYIKSYDMRTILMESIVGLVQVTSYTCYNTITYQYSGLRRVDRFIIRNNNNTSTMARKCMKFAIIVCDSNLCSDLRHV